LDWLLEESQPAARYFALTDLLGREESDPEVAKASSQISMKGWAASILKAQMPDGRWETKSPSTPLYGPKYTSTNWMALILSDFGFTKASPRIRKVADLYFKEWLSLPSWGNAFNDEVCIVGNTARMMTKFGYGDDFRVRKLFDRLVEDQKEDGGWHCFRSDSGSLDCWEALAAYASLPESLRTRKIKESIERGAEFYLKRKLFDDGHRKYAPWFRFHYPYHYYYDVLVGLDVLTRLGYGGDKRLRPALAIMKKKRTTGGTWLLDRVHPDIGAGAQYSMRRTPVPFALEVAGKPSKWITLTALRVAKRVEDAS